MHPDTASDLRNYYYDPPGSLPGTIYGKKDAKPPKISFIDFNLDKYIGQELRSAYEVLPFLEDESVSWLDVQGLGHRPTLRALGQVFDLHKLTLEDIANVPQRPKLEEYNEHLLLITHRIKLEFHRGKKDDRRTSSVTFSLATEQVSFVLGQHYLLTVQEESTQDSFQRVRDRIYANKGQIRQKKSDYLAYCILDTIIDAFFPVLEQIGEYIEDLEEEALQSPTPQTLSSIHQIKRDLLTLRRAIWPQREMLAILTRDGSHLISPQVQIYLRDCYDHAAQVIDMIEIYRELASSLMDVYLSSVNNRMNEVMKTLTVISTIFIPLTFIAGIYGMNFHNMPELSWNLGYPFVWGLMIAIAIGLIIFFWKRGWFHSFSGNPYS